MKIRDETGGGFAEDGDGKIQRFKLREELGSARGSCANCRTLLPCARKNCEPACTAEKLK